MWRMASEVLSYRYQSVVAGESGHKGDDGREDERCDRRHDLPHHDQRVRLNK